MAITAESTSSRIIVNISDSSEKTYILQRARHDDRTWKTYTGSGFAVINLSSETTDETTEETDSENTSSASSSESETENDVSTESQEKTSDNETSENTDETETTLSDEVVYINAGDFIDSYDLSDGLYEYRYVDSSITDPQGTDYVYSKFIKYGSPSAIGYSFGNYSSPDGSWGTIVTPDDCRYTYLWGTDFKATNGTYFTDEQIQWLIDEAVKYMERELNITIKRRVIKSCDETDNLTKTTRYKEGDYDDEESYYDFSYRKIQRYGMITTNQRPIIKVTRLDLINRAKTKTSLLGDVVIDKRKGTIKFLNRPWKYSDTHSGIQTSMAMYGSETWNSNMFYAIDYEAGYKTSDEVPEDLRQIIGKVAAISLLNIIGDGLMSGFSSSSLSMDGISESFSSTQSATSAYFGARIAVYKDDVKNYIQENKYKFGFIPIGAL